MIIELLKRHEEDIVGMEIACSGRFIMTCGKTNDLIVWDLKGEVLATVDTYLGSTHMAKISPCGRFVAASGNMGIILFYIYIKIKINMSYLPRKVSRQMSKYGKSDSLKQENSNKLHRPSISVVIHREFMTLILMPILV